MKILIVDEIEVALLFQESLERQGHTTAVASSGPEALALLAHFRPDAVFLELRLSGMSGVEVLRRIRSIDPSLPVIVVTGWAVRREIEDARRLGVTDVIHKPETMREMRVILERLKNIKRGVRPGGRGKRH